jgi:hypothetical protein
MQISASTLLASQQQAVRGVTQSPQPADAFAPLNFKQAAKPAPQPSMPENQATPQTPRATGPVRPGTHVDIKV